MTSQLVALAFALIGAIALALYGIDRQRKRPRKVSAVPAFRSYASEVGRVAEEGVNIHVALGSGAFVSEQGLTGIAALQGMAGLMELSAAYDTPPFITAGDPTLFLLADNQLRGAYARLGNVNQYRPGLVRYIPSSPVVYAAMAATVTLDEPVATTINLGHFDSEVSLLSDAAVRKGAKVLGGSTSPTGIAALLPAVAPDQLIMGEKLFAGGAETIGRSAFWASLRAEDVLRWLVIAGILVVAGASLLGIGG